ncbi:HGR077Wp [Eremothecium sinecaudum]|uniref:HGR077Wp n=1 Tax=Eremothecium sinecaudum TaxID=45286 RepID=A0A0X8HVS7_9SACH|nr:HGR077Wp [Eremothecium sinecaudum]AMD22416.1 HGR077Wp [Eremothecium sinecaudum]
MDQKLFERFQKARIALGQDKAVGGRSKICAVTKRANRFKYRSKDAANEPGASKGYFNAVSVAADRFPGFNMHNSQQFLKNVEDIVCRTREGMFQWDIRWLNPPEIASRGWVVMNAQGVVLELHCRCCQKHLMLDLNDEDSEDDVREQYHVMLSNQHSMRCPWRTASVDLRKHYILSDINVSLDLQRISDALRLISALDVPKGIVASDSVKRISRLFDDADTHLQLLQVLIQGYQLCTAEVIECTRCFHRSSLQSMMEDPDFDGHASWCRYDNPHKLEILLLKLCDMRNPKEGFSLSERIARLEQDVEAM